MSLILKSGVTVGPGVTLKSTATPIVTDGLLLYLNSRDVSSWPGHGSTWYDLSGHGNNATFYQNPSRLDNSGGVVDGTAIDSSSLLTNGDLYFNGTSESGVYQYAAGANLGTNITSWTVNTWFKINSFVSTTELPAIFCGDFTGYEGGNSVNFSLQFYDGGTTNDNKIYGGFYAWPEWHVTQGATISAGVWYNGAVTFDGSTLSLYVDGSLVSSVTGISPNSLVSTLGYRVARRWDGWDTIDGYVPIAMLYNRSLSADEIKQNFNAHRATYEA